MRLKAQLQSSVHPSREKASTGRVMRATVLDLSQEGSGVFMPLEEQVFCLFVCLGGELTLILK